MLNKELLMMGTVATEVLVRFDNGTNYPLVISINGAFESFSVAPNSVENYPIPLGVPFDYDFPSHDGSSPTPELMDYSSNIVWDRELRGYVITEASDNTYMEFTELWG